MSRDCTYCAVLEAQVRQLEAKVMQLQLALQLMASEMLGVSANIAAELEKPTMGRRDLLEQVAARLEFAAETCVGA